MTTTLTINQIKQYLPHRYPFLFVDTVEDVVPGEHIRCKKAVTGNEAVFEGHFPGNPVLPGVIQIEAMGQAGALLAILSGADLDDSKSIYVASITDCRFRKPVVPGDLMELRAKVLRHRLGTWKLGCEVHVAGALVSSATITATSGPRVASPPLPPTLRPPIYGS